MYCPLIKEECKGEKCAWWISESLVIEDACAIRVLTELSKRDYMGSKGSKT